LNTTVKIAKRLDFQIYFKKIFFLISSSSILVSITSSMLLLLSFILHGIRANLSLLIAAFALTFAIYNFDRTIKQKEDLINDPERTRLFAGNRKIWTIVGTFFFIASMALALREGLNIFLTMFSIIAVYTGYGIGFPLIPRLKDIPGVKNLVLVSSWTIVPTILPNLSEYGAVEKKGILLSIMIFYFIFIKIMVNSILYDVRDIKGDSATGVRTLPVVMGVKNVRMILLIFNSTLILWIIECWRLNIFLPFLPILTANIFYGFWYINFFTENINNKRTLLDILVDGEWIPLTLLIALINILSWGLKNIPIISRLFFVC